MTQCIHYEENIFMFLDLLTHINRGLKLDIDEEYFGEKIISDLLFAESGLSRIFLSLKESTLQLDREQYFRFLFKAAERYISIGKKIIAEGNTLSIDFSGFTSRLKESILAQEKLINEIKDLLTSDTDLEETADQISQKEMSFLMADDDGMQE